MTKPHALRPYTLEGIFKHDSIVRVFVVIDAEGQNLEAEEYVQVVEHYELGGKTTIRGPRAYRLRGTDIKLTPCAGAVGFLVEEAGKAPSLLVEPPQDTAQPSPPATDAPGPQGATPAK